MYKTYRYRIKDENCKERLNEMARAVNFVWNFCNETQLFALKHAKKWPTQVDLCNLTAGTSKELGLNSTTIQEVSKEYYKKRVQFKKNSLRWRSNRKSLPWIPFKANGFSFNRETGTAKYNKLILKTWYSRPLVGKICSGSISSDSRGRFYINIVCELGEFSGPTNHHNDVGIDLGLKSLVTTSDGHSVSASRYLRKMERRLALAQKSGKKKLVKNLNAKVSNRRKDYNHKLSSSLVNTYDVIFVGDVKPKDLIKTNMAKSVHDAGWFQLKSFLSYKALAKGGIVLEVSERYSTQTCSVCGCIPETSPKGK